VAQDLIKMGFTDVMVLKGGWQAWEAGGYPTEAKE
jgi:3-mercaptopyruvate sulfurtransferase SseA